MNDNEIFAAVAQERLALAEVFSQLTLEQLRTPSLCAGWSVHEVAAHLTLPFNVSVPGMLWRSLVEPMSYDGAVDRMAKEHGRRPIEGIIAQLRDRADVRRHPPGRPVAPLVDLIVHGEDVRRPLGLELTITFHRAATGMSFLAHGRAVGFAPANRLRGLRFVATDGDAAWGSGQVVHGPAASLLMAAMGRRVAFAELGGAVQVLRDRMDPPPKSQRGRGS